MIEITSKQEGFRRCGAAHGVKAKQYPDDAFNEEQLEQLQAEPMLSVRILEEVDHNKKMEAAGTKGKVSKQ